MSKITDDGLLRDRSAFQLTPHAERLRRNALVLSAIAVFFGIFGLESVELTFVSLDMSSNGGVAVKAALFFAIAYNAVAFAWYGFEEAAQMPFGRLKSSIELLVSQKASHERQAEEDRKSAMQMTAEPEPWKHDPRATMKMHLKERTTTTKRAWYEMRLNWSKCARVYGLELTLPILFSLMALGSLIGWIELQWLEGTMDLLFAEESSLTGPQSDLSLSGHRLRR